jgi:hypothetical protein
MLFEVTTADEVHGHISDADSISAASTTSALPEHTESEYGR